MKNMFEYTKEILVKVSFDKELFRKELKKSIGWVKREEKILLKVWCLATFSPLYMDVVSEVFKSVN